MSIEQPEPGVVEDRVDLVHPHGPAHPDPVHEEVEEHVDPAVAESVHSVRDRFGVRGLRDLITLASYELDVAERAVAELRTIDEPQATPTIGA